MDSVTEGNEDNEGFRLDNSESLFPLLPSVKIFPAEDLKRDIFAFVFFCLICSRQDHSRNPVFEDPAFQKLCEEKKPPATP